MSDIVLVKELLYKELLALGNDVKDELWSEENKRFLELIARDVAHLSAKIVTTEDAARKKRYHRSIALLQNHVLVMAFSRLNVVENEARNIIRRLLHKLIDYTVRAAVAQIGVESS